MMKYLTVKSKYPNRVLTTTSEIGALFPVGQVIEGQSSSAIGEIVKELRLRSVVC